MNDYQDRQIELALREELGGEQPPDLVQSILQKVEGQLPSTVAAANNGQARGDGLPVDGLDSVVPTGDPVAIPFPGRRPWRWMMVATLAAAASLAALIVVPRWVGRPSPGISPGEKARVQPVSFVARRGFVMPQQTETSTLLGRLLLRDGWLASGPESELMMVGVSVLEFRNARAVVKAGRVPDDYEAVGISRLLASSDYALSEEEKNMLRNPKCWVAGLGLAICMLSGNVVIGQETFAADRAGDTVKLADVFNRFDTNDNGKIELAECVCNCSRKCDLNKDGSITREEFAKAVNEMAGSQEAFLALVADHGGVEAFYQAAKSGLLDKVASVSMETVFAFLDKDQSGILEAEECICECSKMADANGDGTVTAQEMKDLVVQHFGSEQAFLTVVKQHGGVEAFFSSLDEQQEQMPSSLSAVFAQYDKDGSGVLEPAECICHGTKMADANHDGKVTQDEMAQIALQIFGTTEKFEKYIADCGGAQAFYQAVASGEIPPPHK